MEIELKQNNAITNDPCALCGSRCDPCGLDFFNKDTEALVCDSCARFHNPALHQAQREALEYIERELNALTCSNCGSDGSYRECAPCGGRSYILAGGFSRCTECGITETVVSPGVRGIPTESAGDPIPF